MTLHRRNRLDQAQQHVPDQLTADFLATLTGDPLLPGNDIPLLSANKRVRTETQLLEDFLTPDAT